MAVIRKSTIAAPLLTALLMAGCGTPTSGPRGEEVIHRATVTTGSARHVDLPYCLVHVNKDVVDFAISNRYRFSGHLHGSRSRRAANIGVGDILGVTIFEAAAGGLFFPADGVQRQGNFLPLPNQQVDERGFISIPYAGSIRAAGLTIAQIQASIIKSLSNKALEPQVIVTVVDRRSDLINVLGDVGTPSRIPASAAGERLVDVLARAGGVRGAATDTWIMVERGGKVQTIPFQAVIREPENNIAIQAQDTVFAYANPQVFMAFGATGVKGLIPFESFSLTVAEGLAKAGGLVDTQAEPRWVFVYRHVPPHVIEKLDPKCRVNENGQSPVIFQFDLREPSGMFLATRFPLQNRDAVYVANARTVEQEKAMRHFQEVNRTLRDPIDTAISAYTLKGLVRGTTSSVIVATPGP